MKCSITYFEKRHAGRLTQAQIARYYNDGLSAAEIARLGGTTKNSILRILHKLRVKVRPARRKIKHGMVALAKRFKVSPGTCYRYLALKKLGAVCVVCGVSDPRVLAINHVNNKKHKIRLSELVAIVAGEKLAVDVRCANCNVLYEHEKGLFPRHQKMIDHIFKTSFFLPHDTAYKFSMAGRLREGAGHVSPDCR